MTVQDEDIGHKDLVGAGETALHTHAGGGSIEIDSGQAVVPAKADTQVDFGITFTATPRVFLTAWNNDFTWLTEVTTTYFKFDNDKNSGTLTVDWMGINI